MTPAELDDVRKLLVAFEDAASWCEQLAEITRERPLGVRSDPHAEEVSRVLQHLEADRQSVARIRARLGIPPVA